MGTNIQKKRARKALKRKKMLKNRVNSVGNKFSQNPPVIEVHRKGGIWRKLKDFFHIFGKYAFKKRKDIKNKKII